ncbi:URE2 [Phlyctema vagabunda]|uniref:URE2 n=1 Tax=Phlyctema vagabunda TaxID=108571 RepID=A0ABR4P530_9HELO
MSATKPITLHGHTGGPNPWKVAIILEELNIPYTYNVIDFADMKKPEYEKICINGRVPAIEDPNTGITLWESGAIIEYLVETYDTKNTLTYTTTPEKFLVKQWLHFQVSGQGPYYGQAVWFDKYHHEKLPSALERYRGQVLRVVSVLDRALAGKKYLVGDKVTYADLAFVTWEQGLPFIFGEQFAGLDLENKYPNYSAWKKSLVERPSVQKINKDKQAIMEAANH